MMTKKKRKPKNRAAVELGKLGGKKLAKKLTKAQRSESARHAINARWDAYRKAKAAGK